ncbi:hypothetical protein A1O3_04224 [Capronia epimyces CBS 606.96]|uniref:Uncharacterized protein n=1 Tax=Capronia epimyces CBS 606.96 TaxID=1182542 RepID=W9YC61_9EURO|nr:uncharacterized protein A1O3_04224 [Capronia epimyces CBS 606.96]EXJ87265.1 hypothetical protein A1O3_04224 [Capronia epimyces CBS 606.96]
MAQSIFGRSLSDPWHPWNERGYKAHIAHSPRSPSEDPYGEEAYHRAFHAEALVDRPNPMVPDPTYYLNSETAKEVVMRRDRELFAPRDMPHPGTQPLQQYNPPATPQQQPSLLPASFAPSVTPTLEQADTRPHERLPSPKYRDESPRSFNKRVKREPNGTASSSSSGSSRPWNKRQEPQTSAPKPLLPATMRSVPEPHAVTVTDSRSAGMDRYAPVPDQTVPVDQMRSPASPGIPTFLEPQVTTSMGPPRMLR